MEEVDEDEYWRKEDFDETKFYEDEGKLRWIWREGVNLGKKMVVTGVVISSAPFVLPPIVALSVIGFAFSLPAGFVFATYACTDKLLNALLPMPSPSPYLYSGSMYSDEEKSYMIDGYEVVKDYDVDGDIGNEVKQFEGDNRMGIELAEEGIIDTRVTEIVEEDVDDERINETVGLLERVRDEGRDDSREQDSPTKGIYKENKQNGGIPIKDMYQETGDKNLFVIPEEVKPARIEGTENLDETVGEVSMDGIEIGTMIEQPEFVVERKLLVDVKSPGDRTDTGERTGSDERTGNVILSNVNSEKMADEAGFGDGTDVLDRSSDLLEKTMPEEEDLASDSRVDVSIDYLEVRIESVSISKQAETELDQEITAESDKVMLNEEKIWEQIQAMRTIIGYKTEPHTSCVEELKALYEFTGVELPITSKDATELAYVDEKLHFLKSIVGVR